MKFLLTKGLLLKGENIELQQLFGNFYHSYNFKANQSYFQT